MLSRLSKKTKGILVGILILSLAAAGLFGWWGSTVPLEHVVASAPAGEQVYGIDRGDDAFRIFRMDTQGRLLGEIVLREREGSSYRTYGALSVDGDAVYVLERSADVLSDLVQWERVYRCDFEKGRLDLVWDLPVLDPSMDSNLSVQVREGVLTCFQADYEGRVATGRVLRAVQGGALELVAEFEQDIGVGFTEFYAAASGRCVFTTPKGEIYWLDPETDMAPRRIYPVAGAGASMLFFANDGADRVFAAGHNGRVFVVDLAAGRPRAELLFAGEARFPVESGMRVGMLRAPRFDAGGGFTATLEGDGSARMGYFRETGDRVYAALSAPAGRIALRAALGFLGAWLAALVLALLVRAFLWATKGKVPIVTKLLFAFLPILLISLLLIQGMSSRIFADQIMDGHYEELFLLTRQQVSKLNPAYVEELEPATAHDSVYFYQLRALLNVLPDQGALYQDTGGETPRVQDIYSSTYFWLYKVMEDGSLVSLVCEMDYIGVPVEYRYQREVSDRFYQAVREDRCIRAGFQDTLGDWNTVLTPVHNGAGDVVGLVETGDTRQAMEYAVEQGARRLALLNLSVMAVLALLLCAVIVISLHPLKILRDRVQEISDGKLGVQAPERGNDEVAEITRVFNTMSRNVEFRAKEMTLTNEGYARFVPSRVFGLLEKSSVIDVRLEDQTTVDAAVLNCTVGAFDDIARTLHSKEMFKLINQVLARLVPVVDESGGLVDRFDRAGLLAIYTEKTGKALDAAVTLCQILRKTELEGAGERAMDFHVTVSAGPAMIGIVGAERRLEAMTVSEHTNFTSFLRPLAAEYGACVLLTGSAADRIPDFAQRYHARTIGFVHMRVQDRLERLYDVFDADEETTRRLKQETREIFEQGVALYCSHRFYDARMLFIEVLKKNRTDQAAKNYLYRCDTYYRRDDGGENMPVYIEAY